jgi:hypothetical protein
MNSHAIVLLLLRSQGRRKGRNRLFLKCGHIHTRHKPRVSRAWPKRLIVGVEIFFHRLARSDRTWCMVDNSLKDRLHGLCHFRTHLPPVCERDTIGPIFHLIVRPSGVAAAARLPPMTEFMDEDPLVSSDLKQVSRVGFLFARTGKVNEEGFLLGTQQAPIGGSENVRLRLILAERRNVFYNDGRDRDRTGESGSANARCKCIAQRSRLGLSRNRTGRRSTARRCLGQGGIDKEYRRGENKQGDPEGSKEPHKLYFTTNHDSHGKLRISDCSQSSEDPLGLVPGNVLRLKNQPRADHLGVEARYPRLAGCPIHRASVSRDPGSPASAPCLPGWGEWVSATANRLSRYRQIPISPASCFQSLVILSEGSCSLIARTAVEGSARMPEPSTPSDHFSHKSHHQEPQPSSHMPTQPSACPLRSTHPNRPCPIHRASVPRDEWAFAKRTALSNCPQQHHRPPRSGGTPEFRHCRSTAPLLLLR